MKYSILILILIGILPHIGLTQKEQSFIHGEISDKSHIRSISKSNLVIYKANKKVGEVTNGRGMYQANLFPGTYNLEINAVGFHTMRKDNVQLMNGDTTKLDFILNPINETSTEITIVDTESQNQMLEESNAAASINDDMIITSRGVKAPLLTVKGYKKPIKKKKPTISPAKYEVYRNKEAKSPFRYPVAKIPMVVKTNALENLVYKISKDGLPHNDKDLKEIVVEDLLNSWEYNYPTPQNINKPFGIYTELFPCPWNEDKRLLHIGIQTIEMDSVTAISQSNRPMAEEVDINIEFNPAYVSDYRLIGYEDYFPNLLSYRTDPSMDATMMTGQSLTAIYEFTPIQNKFASEDQKLLYQQRSKSLEDNNELGALQVYYRAPSARKRWKVCQKINRSLKSEENVAENTLIAVSIAEIAMRLKGSPHIKTGSTNDILKRIRNIEELSEKGDKILEMVETIQKLEATK